MDISPLVAPQTTGQVRFDQNLNEGGVGLRRVYTIVIQLSIVVFTGSLFWFAFAYYPKVIDKYKNVPLPVVSSTAGKVSASYIGFPIETNAFRITYEGASNSYYVFVTGGNLPSFVENKNSAILALKTTLSVDSACRLNIFYVSTQKLKIPDNLKTTPNCN